MVLYAKSPHDLVTEPSFLTRLRAKADVRLRGSRLCIPEARGIVTRLGQCGHGLQTLIEFHNVPHQPAQLVKTDRLLALLLRLTALG